MWEKPTKHSWCPGYWSAIMSATLPVKAAAGSSLFIKFRSFQFLLVLFFFCSFFFPLFLYTHKKNLCPMRLVTSKRQNTHTVSVVTCHPSPTLSCVGYWLPPPLARQRRCTAITANVIVTSNRALKNHKAMPRIKHATAHSHIDAHFLPWNVKIPTFFLSFY